MRLPHTKLPTNRGGWISLIAVAAICSACTRLQMSSGKGQVTNTTTKQPIAGATISLECERYGLIHGSFKVRDVVISSDADGIFNFSFLDVAGCQFGHVYASKPGFQASEDIDPQYDDTRYERIPKYKYLTPEADVVMLKLEALTINGVHTLQDGRPAYGADYAAWYLAFFEAKDIAKTERERKFVHERYCEPLLRLYPKITDDEKAHLARFVISYKYYKWHDTQKQGKFDYEGEVLPYCAN